MGAEFIKNTAFCQVDAMIGAPCMLVLQHCSLQCHVLHSLSMRAMDAITPGPTHVSPAALSELQSLAGISDSRVGRQLQRTLCGVCPQKQSKHGKSGQHGSVHGSLVGSRLESFHLLDLAQV